MILFDDKSELQYITSGQFKTDEEWIHPDRLINSNEIIFVQSGTVYIAEENNFFELKKNDILILEKEKRHYGYKASSGLSFYWVHFLYSDFERLPKSLTLDSPMSLITMLTQLLHMTNTLGYEDSCGDLLCGLILQEILFADMPVSSRVKRLAVNIREWVRINSDKILTSRAVSEEFHYNEDYINRIFKQSYGITLKQYIINQRLDKAKLFLTTTMYTVKRISHMLGYSEENLFVKFFVYHMKMTPTEYRNIYINTHINKK